MRGASGSRWPRSPTLVDPRFPVSGLLARKRRRRTFGYRADAPGWAVFSRSSGRFKLVTRIAPSGLTPSDRPGRAFSDGRQRTIYIMMTISSVMAEIDAVTSIPVHQSTLRALRGAKMADQTWDDFLLALADDYLAPSQRAELDRRLKTEKIVRGADMKAEFLEWRKRRARSK